MGRALLTFERKRVDIGAADMFQGGDGIRAHALMRLRMQGAQMLIAAVHER